MQENLRWLLRDEAGYRCSMRTLYLRTGLAARLDPRCAVLHVTPLLRELIIETVNIGQLRIRDRYECALCP
jgi:DNA-binding IclR family transcriptional regulator